MMDMTKELRVYLDKSKKIMLINHPRPWVGKDQLLYDANDKLVGMLNTHIAAEVIAFIVNELEAQLDRL